MRGIIRPFYPVVKRREAGILPVNYQIEVMDLNLSLQKPV